jgi:hypothetical protein
MTNQTANQTTNTPTPAELIFDVDLELAQLEARKAELLLERAEYEGIQKSV